MLGKVLLISNKDKTHVFQGYQNKEYLCVIKEKRAQSRYMHFTTYL